MALSFLNYLLLPNIYISEFITSLYKVPPRFASMLPAFPQLCLTTEYEENIWSKTLVQLSRLSLEPCALVMHEDHTYHTYISSPSDRHQRPASSVLYANARAVLVYQFEPINCKYAAILTDRRRRRRTHFHHTTFLLCTCTSNWIEVTVGVIY